MTKGIRLSRSVPRLLLIVDIVICVLALWRTAVGMSPQPSHQWNETLVPGYRLLFILFAVAALSALLAWWRIRAASSVLTIVVTVIGLILIKDIGSILLVAMDDLLASGSSYFQLFSHPVVWLTIIVGLLAVVWPAVHWRYLLEPRNLAAP